MPRSITAPTRPPPGMPPEFLCAINGHVMKNPVTSPTGHTFEKETIEYWLKQVVQAYVAPVGYDYRAVGMTLELICELKSGKSKRTHAGCDSFFRP